MIIDTDFRYFEIFCENKPQIEFCGGNYTDVVPPDPISNSEVKYIKADGSAMRESR